MNYRNIISIGIIQGAYAMPKRFVLPAEIKDLDDNVTVIVNRTRVNSQLVKLRFCQDGSNLNSIKIIRDAIKNMLQEEKKYNITLIGPKMKVQEIKQVFQDIEQMPSNSFAYWHSDNCDFT